MKQYFGYLSLLLAAVIYSSFGIYIRVLNQELNAYQQIFFRGFIGFVLASLLALNLKKKFSVKRVSKPILFGYMVTFPFSVILYVFSILSTKIATTLFGYYVGTLLFSLLIGRVIFKEPIHIIKKLSMGLTFLGLIAYTYPLSVQTFNVGLILALIAGFFDSIANALRKYVAGKIDRIILVVLQLLGMAMVSLPFVLLTLDKGIPTISPLSWLVGLWFGLMLLAINYLLLFAFSRFDLNLGTIVLSSELFFAAVLAYFVFGETIKPQELAGAILIVFATGLVGLDPSKFNANAKEFLTRYINKFRGV
jgi:drug/metabolite transporter (DMT)-like permease